jgi:Cu(I)/Ag(I) efflux system periplasmic protein CusF
MASGAKTLAIAALCLSSFSFAQKDSHTSSHHTADLVEGVVEMVDTKAHNITLRHAEIRNVQMPAMTMVFGVKDAALLDKVKAGDKVKFRVEIIGGAPTVTVIEVAN